MKHPFVNGWLCRIVRTLNEDNPILNNLFFRSCFGARKHKLCFFQLLSGNKLHEEDLRFNFRQCRKKSNGVRSPFFSQVCNRQKHTLSGIAKGTFDGGNGDASLTHSFREIAQICRFIPLDFNDLSHETAILLRLSLANFLYITKVHFAVRAYFLDLTRGRLETFKINQKKV